jgi:N-dimethylarginine dimethylaminohydrolase
MTDPSAAAYGGPNWRPRSTDLRAELGDIWAPFSVGSEWTPLTDVLLHPPGPELSVAGEPDGALMLAAPDWQRASAQHEALSQAYRDAGVQVHFVDPAPSPSPNQMFVADLMFMTRCGAIVGRPASPVRAGEERWVARRLADLGIPILRTVAGRGTFEGADAAWLDGETVIIGRGLRTNEEGARQVAATLEEQGVGTVLVDLPRGSMHLMGELRFADRDLAYVRPGRTPEGAIEALEGRGLRVSPFPAEDENLRGMAHNFVTLGPRRILMAAGNPISEEAYGDAGLDVVPVEVDELAKAAGAMGCLTGVLARETAG